MFKTSTEEATINKYLKKRGLHKTITKLDNRGPKKTLQKNEMYAEILLPLKMDGPGKSLTYRIPDDMKKEMEVGKAVRVPVRGKKYTGIASEMHEKEIKFEAKDILSIKEGGRLLEPWQIELAEWISDHYFAPLYKGLKLMLPKKLWQKESKIPYELTFERTSTPTPEKLGAKQHELIKIFDQEKRVQRKAIPKFSLSTIRSLEKRELIKEVTGKITALNLENSEKFTPKKLTPDQQKAFDTIQKTKKPGSLLHGITGSGKTEVYLQLAQKMVKDGKQIIIMVPEIALTPQLIDYFTGSFGEKLAILHSRLSEGEREREWWRIQTGAARVVIGSRSAIFAPTKDLGLIVIDEEHEWSYKQDKSPYYHARDVAFKIADLTGAKVLLGSATPDVETMYRAKKGELEHLTLGERITEGSALPEVHIADMREELHKKNFSIFSEKLSEKLEQTFAAKEQAILFLNRRGHSSCIICRDCGEVCQCEQCDVSLTYHRFKNGYERLVCHHCGLTAPMPTECGHCKGYAIKFVGLGTQQVETELQKRFPTMRILRADKDTTGKKDSFKKMYQALKNHEVDVLIGTQMVSKGLDLPNVTLVGVVLADVGLHIPDFRSSERGFQLLTQVAGRAGRAEKPGNVIIQTYNPDHESIQCAARHDYKTFYDFEIASRNQLKNPPFNRTIKLTFKDADHKKCSTEARRLEELLKPMSKHHNVHAAPALIARKHNKFRWHVYLQGPNPHELLKKALQENPLPIGWAIDVDPVVMT